MAMKRKAKEAFGKQQNDDKAQEKLFSSDGVSSSQLSAFAAARSSAQPPIPAAAALGIDDEDDDDDDDEDDLVAKIAGAPYNGHYSGTTTPALLPASDAEDEASRSITPRTNMVLSTFVRKKANVLHDDQERLQLKMRIEESVTFVGEYDLEVLQGLVTVHGAMLHPGSGKQRIYAPSTSALPAIIAKKDGTVISAVSVRSGLSALEKLSPLFRNIFVEDESNGRSFILLSGTTDDPLKRSLAPLEIDDETKKVLSRLSAGLESGAHWAKIMVVGPKSTGKSTFNRLLCNMITSKPGINRCLYLDLDPGQPEFGPPGQLSLVEIRAPVLGPAFSHPASTQSELYRLVRSHTVAATSFKDDPEHYLGCASELARHVGKDVPLVINTCGWVTGLGADALVSLTKALSISDAILLEPIDKDLSGALSELVTNPLHRIPKRQRLPGSRSPAELRAMQTMAYFHHKPSTGMAKWQSKPLTAARHCTVSYSSPSADITAILSYGQAPHPDYLTETIDGAIVAIVVLQDSDALDVDTISWTSDGVPYVPANATGHTPALDPSKSRCLGLALVRAIDMVEKTFQLVTPLSNADLESLAKKPVVLVRGNFDPPDWAYQEDLYAGQDDTDEDRPWVSRRERGGIEGAVWRLRHPPMAKDVR